MDSRSKLVEIIVNEVSNCAGIGTVDIAADGIKGTVTVVEA